MSHHASSNWGNVRTNPERGIQQGPRIAYPNHVRALLCGTEDESIVFITRHAENESFLRIAEEIEAARKPVRSKALKLIRQLKSNLAARSLA